MHAHIQALCSLYTPWTALLNALVHMDEREVLQWRVNQAHAEQMGDLKLIPLSDQQSGHSWSVLSLHGA